MGHGYGGIPGKGSTTLLSRCSMMLAEESISRCPTAADCVSEGGKKSGNWLQFGRTGRVGKAAEASTMSLCHKPREPNMA